MKSSPPEARQIVREKGPAARKLTFHAAGPFLDLFHMADLRSSPIPARMGAMEMLSRIWISSLERGYAGLQWAARHSGRASALPEHLITGMTGEDAAYFYLRRKGYVVVARRWSAPHQHGDIDLIAWRGTLLCIVEVKTRTAHDMAPAEATVDSHKRMMLRRLARQYIRLLPQAEAPQVRFDVIGVYLVPGKKKEFVHFEAAFGWGDGRDFE